MLKLLALVALLAAPLPLGLWIARKTFRPVWALAEQRRLPFQFGLGELASLMIYLSAALSFGRWFAGHISDSGAALMAFFLVILASSVWWSAIRAVSGAGIDQRLRRSVFVLVAVPVGYMMSFLIPTTLLLGMVYLAERSESYLPPDVPFFLGGILLMGGIVSIGGVVLWMLRRLSEWVVAETQRPPWRG